VQQIVVYITPSLRLAFELSFLFSSADLKTTLPYKHLCLHPGACDHAPMPDIYEDSLFFLPTSTSHLHKP